MPGKFLKILISQVVALSLSTPAAAQEAVPAALFRKGGFQQRVERQLSEHERRLTHLELVSTPRATAKAPARGKAPASARTSSGASAHTVRAGETPSSIARKYGVTVSQLLQANGLVAGAIIRPGQKLALSGTARAKAAAPPPAGAVATATAVRSAPAARAPAGWARHTVQRGETVRGLAARFGLSEKELMRLNGLQSPTKLRAGAVVKYPVAAAAADPASGAAVVQRSDSLPAGWEWHTVQPGESLSQIAARYGQDRRSLEQSNALQAGAAIPEGLRLKIPPTGTPVGPPASASKKRPAGGEDHSVLAYTVQKGDTLEALSKTFATTPAILRKLNRLSTSDILAVGHRIVVPNNLFE